MQTNTARILHDPHASATRWAMRAVYAVAAMAVAVPVYDYATHPTLTLTSNNARRTELTYTPGRLPALRPVEQLAVKRYSKDMIGEEIILTPADGAEATTLTRLEPAQPWSINNCAYYEVRKPGLPPRRRLICRFNYPGF